MELIKFKWEQGKMNLRFYIIDIANDKKMLININRTFIFYR